MKFDFVASSKAKKQKKEKWNGWLNPNCNPVNGISPHKVFFYASLSHLVHEQNHYCLFMRHLPDLWTHENLIGKCFLSVSYNEIEEEYEIEKNETDKEDNVILERIDDTFSFMAKHNVAHADLTVDFNIKSLADTVNFIMNAKTIDLNPMVADLIFM